LDILDRHPSASGERQLQHSRSTRWTTQITFVSSLTPEDEDRSAVALLDAVGGLLDLMPIAYSIRVETSSGKWLDRTHAPQAANVAASDQLSAVGPREPARDVLAAALRVVDHERHRPAAILPGALVRS
jgi:hypothetical protein